MYWDILNMRDEDFKKLQKVVDKMLEEGKEYRRKIKEEAIMCKCESCKCDPCTCSN